jgi:hypothetical protein
MRSSHLTIGRLLGCNWFKCYQIFLGRVLINAQVAAGYALTLRLRGSVNVPLRSEREKPSAGGSILDRVLLHSRAFGGLLMNHQNL